MFGKRKKQVVGCDVGSSSIKLVELKPLKNDEFQLVHAAIAELSPEAIVDGAIMDSSLVVDALTRLISENGIKNTKFGGSLSGHSVIIKKIQLPSMTEAELAESIQWEAEQYIPFDINDVNLDYVVLDTSGSDTMDVLLVAVKKDRINDYTSVIVQAGKEPVLVDVDVFAVQNAFESNYSSRGETVALVNVGASVMNINVLHDGNSVFWRDVAFGGNLYTEAIQREFNLPREEAEQLKLGGQVGQVSRQQVDSVLNAASEDLAAELQKTIDFFVATSSVDRIDRIMLSGGGALAANLSPILQERFQVQVELLNPFRNIRYNESDFDPDWINRNAPAMAVAVGLAIRTVGG
ncbi:MAG TPA: type IV pilus assembly protein PilM [Candidatus Sulfomarinibacteraceae bacterium]|nr:type IV pilus assembly protein PilM [Candidatus Sulfomarinibacteraceae bacterium]